MPRYLNLASWTLFLVVFGVRLLAAQAAGPGSLPATQPGSDRGQYQSSGRLISNVTSPSGREEAFSQKLRMRERRTGAQGAPGIGGVWVPLGPLPLPSDASGTGLYDYGWVSGRATAIAIDPNDPSGNTVYAGTAGGGVWKSSNAGTMSASPASVVWLPLTDDQATLSVGTIAVQPQLANPDPSQSVVLAGTGETNSARDAYYGLGILRSADGGQTWTLISQDSSGHSFAGLGFSKIVFSATNPNLAVAAVASSSAGVLEGLENPIAVNRGIYYSNDAGITWQKASINDAGVSIDPSSVTSVAYNAAAGRFYAAVRSHGFYSSSDGANWTRLAVQPGSGISSAVCPAQSTVPSTCLINRGEIAVVPGRPGPANLGEMYVWYVDSNDADQGIWKTLDGGASWIQLDDSGITNCGDPTGCGTSNGSDTLALAALPDGTATDIYAGAANIYKCMITNAVPNCSGTGLRSFLNLTHACGCSDIARVHPGQHAIDFLVANGASLLYFANDGGIYRSLDGYLGLRNGACGTVNQFDSLNATLGPVTQVVSLSESATDANLILSGSARNGAPATGSSQSAGTWVNVNTGDNGLTAVNPANEDEWFVATPPDVTSGVNLFRCANGVSCHSQDFHSGRVADSSALGGDAGPFPLPFILDPQNPGTLILGTCRVFRGPSTGGGFQLLSPDFENGGGGPCRGSEVNMVRTLAAGGPVDTNGNSQVIYAGTDGAGPLTPTTPQGGRLWVATNAGGGLPSWIDRTGSINPKGFPISAIALDTFDPTGRTAYVTIMGFHVSQVWKTTNAGISWTDFTANLPDAPANAIVVDSSSSTVYVGTDIGVFASSTGNPSWIEVGPAAGQSGFLPNAVVTALGIFNSGGLKRLRAATYGRGIWEWNLITAQDFQVGVSNTPLTVFPSQSAIFSGAIYALNGYSNLVNLSCAAGGTAAPQSCIANPGSLTPSATGSSFGIAASDVPGDYLFNVHAAGTDPALVTHDFPLVLHVVDFLLGAPSPGAVTVIPGQTSTPVSLLVSALGAFSGQVTLSCSGLPQGASCQFQPSSVVSPTAGNAVNVTLTITATASVPLGSSLVTISASTPGEAAKNQILSVSIGAAPDYVLAITNSPQTIHVGGSAVFNGTLTALNGYGSSVNLACGAGAPPACTVSPSSLVPDPTGSAFTVTAFSNISQQYDFDVVGTGSDQPGIVHSAPMSLTVLPAQSFDFTMGVSPISGSTPAGQPASFSVTVAPIAGAFPNGVSFSCGKMPALSNCSFTPAQVAAGNGNSTVALTISTTSPTPSAALSSISFLAFPLAALMWLARRKSLPGRRVFLTLTLFLSIASLSCGGGLHGNAIGGGNPGTPPGTYSIQITANAVSVSHSSVISLTVTP